MCRKNGIKRLGFISLVLLLVSASACAWPISELSGAQASQEKAPGMSSAQVQTAPQAVLSSLSVEQAKDLEKLKSELESSATSLAESKALLAQQSAELAILRAEIESLQGLSEASSAATAALQAAYDELEAQAMKLQAERDEYYARAVKAEAQRRAYVHDSRRFRNMGCPVRMGSGSRLGAMDQGCRGDPRSGV